MNDPHNGWSELLVPHPVSDPHTGLWGEPRVDTVERFDEGRRETIRKALRLEDASEFIDRLEWCAARVNHHRERNRRPSNDESFSPGVIPSKPELKVLDEAVNAVDSALASMNALHGPILAHLQVTWRCDPVLSGYDLPAGLPRSFGGIGDHSLYLQRLARVLRQLQRTGSALRGTGVQADTWNGAAAYCCVEVMHRATGEIPSVFRDADGQRYGPIFDLLWAAFPHLDGEHPGTVEKCIAARRRPLPPKAR